MPANFTTLDINDPYDIQQNLQGSARHLRGMLNYWKERPNNKYDTLTLALASYHSGIGNINRVLTRGGQLTPRTIKYVNDIISFTNEFRR